LEVCAVVNSWLKESQDRVVHNSSEISEHEIMPCSDLDGNQHNLYTVESRYIEVTGTAVYSSKYPRFDISV